MRRLAKRRALHLERISSQEHRVGKKEKSEAGQRFVSDVSTTEGALDHHLLFAGDETAEGGESGKRGEGV